MNLYIESNFLELICNHYSVLARRDSTAGSERSAPELQSLRCSQLAVSRVQHAIDHAQAVQGCDRHRVAVLVADPADDGVDPPV